jgi:YidC/Oxa1 family membrane protein insertase
VFLALYYSLKHFSREPAAKHPGSLGFLHFIPSIAAHTTTHWGGFVLLVVYVGSQLASSYYMSASADKMQRTLLMVMPVVFVFVIARFPAGLVLYWVTTNLWTVGQGLITRRLIPKPAAPEKRTSRTAPRDEGDGGENGTKSEPAGRPPSQPQRAAGPPRKVRRKKKAGRR